METKQERLYTPKETAESLGITPDLLRIWTIEFNVVTAWTKADQKGHRRYTKENIETLMTIRNLIHNQNWNYDQVRAWQNGHEDAFLEEKGKAEIEKKTEVVLEKQEQILNDQQDFHEKQMAFNQALLKRLDLLTLELKETKRKLLESEEERETMKGYIENKLEKRDQLLLENIRKQQEVPKEESKQENWQEQLNETLAQRDQLVMETIQSLQKQLQDQQKTHKKGFFSRLFS